MTEEGLVRLEACPFCGGEAYQKTRQDEDIWSHNIVPWTQVGCHECDFFFEGPPGIEPTPAEHWNTRAPRTAPSDGEGWKPIETAPKDGTLVFLWDAGLPSMVPVVGFWGSERRWYFWDGDCVWLEAVQEDFAELNSWQTGYGPTHWRPLPHPPTDSEE